MEQLLYGGDYNPEQWLDRPDILEKDIEYLKEAKINVVTLGVFAWSMLEPQEGRYELDWLEEVIDRLYRNDISVILATPSGARPKWLADKYSEVLRVNEDRTQNLFGGRHNHCYTSQIYRQKVGEMDSMLAKRFAEHPAIRLWHISNEFGGECHCQACQKAFREWLKGEYETIEMLNQSWWTTFWSHRYDSFAQIESPSTIGENAVHGLNLDWKRFVTDQTIDFMKSEIKALRENGAMQPTTANLMYDFKGLNYGKLAKHIDVVSWDSYPLWHKQDDCVIAWDTAMQHDYMRSLKQQPFLLMESCPTGTNWQGVSKLKKPGLLNAASLQAVAHGSDSVQYFQIRQSRGSSEKFHGAVIDHSGRNDTRVFQEIAALGEDLVGLSAVRGSHVQATAAVIYDVENRWALEDSQGPRNNGLYYHEAAVKSYQAFRKYGLDTDVIDMDQELEYYKVIAAPMLYMLRSGVEEKLRKFVADGGILFMTYFSGVVNHNDLCFMGETPHGLTDVIGVHRKEIDGLYDEEANTAKPLAENELGIVRSYQCKNLCELVSIETAKPLMVYEKDFYAGQPVLTCNTFGKGRAYYIGADMEQDFYDDLYEKVLTDSGMPGLLADIPKGVMVTSRTDGERRYIFIQNYTEESQWIEIPRGAEVLHGSAEGHIERFGTVVISV